MVLVQSIEVSQNGMRCCAPRTNLTASCNISFPTINNEPCRNLALRLRRGALDVYSLSPVILTSPNRCRGFIGFILSASAATSLHLPFLTASHCTLCRRHSPHNRSNRAVDSRCPSAPGLALMERL
jgi:hypothetical protein